jgi:pSer/pThr/pTyr-binding forkhead associated (FHA) protein
LLRSAKPFTLNRAMYRLVFLNGPDKGKRLAIREPLITVGRDPDCFLRLTDEEASRKHAIIEQRPEGVFLKDLDATNPTLVNDTPVREARLQNGDRIEFGSTLLQFQILADATDAQRRRVSHGEGIATAAVVIIIAAQVALLAYLASRHRAVVGDQMAATPEQQPAEQTVAPPETAPATAPSEQEAAASKEPVESEPAAGATASATTNLQNAPDADLQTLRAEVDELKRQVEGLAAPTTTAAVAAVPPPEAPGLPAAGPEQDAVLVRAQAMLRQASAEIARMNFVRADEQLQRIQIMAPDFLPAYIERARLFERRGMLKAAGEQWAEVLNRSMGTPLYEQAAAERIRLARLEVAQPTQPATGEPPADAAGRLPRRIRILDIQQERFPKNEQFDEMRLLRVTLKPKPGEKELDPYYAKVVVTFFDENTETQKVQPTRAMVSKALSPEGPWREGEQRNVSATYIVPKGFREQEIAQYGERMLYYGYVVQVYYREQLQDVEARPRSLIQQLGRIPSPVHKP